MKRVHVEERIQCAEEHVHVYVISCVGDVCT